ncbi:histone H1.10 [Orycteropus afer afer]|uniref:Histone H1.10 n=1 Tax=Orycteropus afer afer TaxID=1230840 RepID=A0A8B7AMV6_ORYAF|nr:histone H1.10 [Orycteropus afer afer]
MSLCTSHSPSRPREGVPCVSWDNLKLILQEGLGPPGPGQGSGVPGAASLLLRGLGLCPGRRLPERRHRGGAVQEASGRGRGSKKHKLALAPDQAVVVLNVVRHGAIKAERGALLAKSTARTPSKPGWRRRRRRRRRQQRQQQQRRQQRRRSSAALSPSKKRKNSKKKNQPGKYSQLVVETIRRLGERNGSSLAKIYTEAKKVAWFDQQNGRTYLKYSIKALVQNDTLLQVKGTGANGSFKLNRKKLEGGGERRGGPTAAPAPAATAHKAKKAAPGAAGSQRADKKPVKSKKPEKRSHKKDPSGGAAAVAKKDKGSKAKKAVAAGGKKVKKAAKPSVPKVPKGRK